MSRASKLTLAGTSLFAVGTVFFVHYTQQAEKTHSPKQKAIINQRFKDTEPPREAVRIKIKQRAVKGLHLPSRDQQQKRQERKNSSTSTKNNLTALIPAFVTVRAETRVPLSRGVDDGDEGEETEDPCAGAVEHLVDDEFAGEDAGFEGARGTRHDVCLGFFHAEAEGEEGGGDHVDPEDFEGGEGEDGGAGGVFEGEGDEEEDYLGDVGDEEVH
ncbi:hypothetical protein HYFRA_00000234 [Hymenoscyphus fraxineus]|uniref:Uncharacterized protein n=1 Tax=Hymenoscyphus fraxineus TaxID=746836 RepID=A0A9N9L2H2_9HELO|nr:hypothetical protein HYFRA_00000234 [Hymenoscyphus fraxineus]